MKIPFFKSKESLPYDFTVKPMLVFRNLPPLSQKEDIRVRYPLLLPHAAAHIFWNPEHNELVYEVEEPKLNSGEREMIELIKLNLVERFNFDLTNEKKPQNLIKLLEKNVKIILKELKLDKGMEAKKYMKYMYYIYRDFLGLNKIEPLLHDIFVEDIECNGINEPVYIVHRIYENMRTNVIYNDLDELRDFVEKLAQKSGKYVSYAKPLLDSALPDGSRVNATYSDDVTTRGPTFTIRKFNKEPLTPVDLILSDTGSPEIFAYLWLVLESKFNIMIIGETASGKTTLLNGIANFILPEARICSIEDTREINLAHSNWLPSVARTGFGTPNLMGVEFGEITLFDLLKESFRQNPDYVIVGEARGKEANVMFQGMASGHPTIATFHAESVNTLLRRLENPPINLPPTLLEVLDVVVSVGHFKARDRNFRKITKVDEILQFSKDQKPNTNAFVSWMADDEKYKYNKSSVMLDRISEKTGMDKAEVTFELNVRAALLERLTKSNVRHYKEFSEVINSYYKEPEKTLADWGVEIEQKRTTNSKNRSKKRKRKA